MAYLELTVPAGSVSSNLTGYVTYVSLSDLPEAFWLGVSDNGGDVRVKTASGDALPTDLVWLDTASRTGALFFRSDLLSASDNVFQIHYATGLSRLAVNDTYGRNAVWQDYEFVSSLGVDPSDRTGNHNPLRGLVAGARTFEAVAQSPLFAQDPHQGVAWDGTYWYLLHTNAVYKFDADWTLVASNTDPIGDTGLATVNHLGDGTCHGSFLYTLLEEYPASPYDSQYIVKLDTADLSVVATYDISAQGHEVSSLCYCERDGYLYVTDYTSDNTLYKYQLDGTYVGTLAVDSTYAAPNGLRFQGIEWFNDAFWLTADDVDLVYRMEYDGTVLEAGFFGETVTGSFEGICRKQGRLVTLSDPSGGNSYLTEWQPKVLDLGAGGGYTQESGTTQHLAVTSLPSLTTFTLGVTLSPSALGQNRAALSYHDQSAGTANTRVSLAYSNANGSLGVWDPANLWQLPSPVCVPALNRSIRLHSIYNGTTARELYLNGGLKATQAGNVAAPGTLSELLIGREDSSNAEQYAGSLGLVYLRGQALSADWLAAEYANLSSPSAFYTVPEDAADFAKGTSFTVTAGFTTGTDFYFTPPTREGSIALPSPLGSPALYGETLTAKLALAAVSSPLQPPSLAGLHGSQSWAFVPSPLGSPALYGQLATRLFATAPSPLQPPAVKASVLRYEVRGEVRDQGILVDRRVRVYSRETGELLGQSDTVVGAFRIPLGFTAQEAVIVPIDLAPDAVDFSPPCANRVLSVLAED
jgi:hypothetical protein